MRVFNQDPAGDAGRRAAQAGRPIGDCPYPVGNWLGDRWRAVYLDETARLGALEHIDCQPSAIFLGTEPYSAEETRSIQAMLEHGRDASYIARVLNRPVHSVEVKIGAMMKAAPAWSPAQDTDLIARAKRPDRPSLKQIASELGRTVHSVGSRLAHHGIRLKDVRAAASAKAAE